MILPVWVALAGMALYLILAFALMWIVAKKGKK
jgi:hypothetical protein